MSVNPNAFFVFHIAAGEFPDPKPKPEWPPVEPTPVPPVKEPVPTTPPVTSLHFDFYPFMLN